MNLINCLKYFQTTSSLSLQHICLNVATAATYCVVTVIFSAAVDAAAAAAVALVAAQQWCQ